MNGREKETRTALSEELGEECKKKEFNSEVRNMKKIIFVLAMILIVAPAFGGVSVELLKRPSGNIVDVNYSGANDGNRPRAFALDITITPPATITGIDDYKAKTWPAEGESNSLDPGYGIYPGTIIVVGNDVNKYGSPVAAPGSPCSGTGLNTSHIVLELGSLWYNRTGDGNAPLESDRLCSLAYNLNSATGNVDIVMTEEENCRGGVILEDGSVPIQPVEDSLRVQEAPLPGPATNVNPTNGNPKVPTTTDLTWTAGSGATSHKIYFGTDPTPPYVVGGDVAMPATTYDTLTMVANKTYYWNIVAHNDAGDSAPSATWSFTTECYGNRADYAQWVDAGKPDCWCYLRQCHGDGDGKKAGGTKTGYYYVDAADLTLLTGAWKVKNPPIGPGCTGTMGCADFDHKKAGGTKTGYYRVDAGDLTILTTNWKVKESPIGKGTDPNCLPGNRTP
jgi:hypothetical protein